MMSKYEYAFGQWVLDPAGYKYRYLGKNSNGNALIYSPGIADIDAVYHFDIRPDPEPPELVAGQLVMVRDNINYDWEGPYEYVGCGSNHIDSFKHAVSCEGRYRYAKPYIPEPEDKPEPSQLDAIRAELADLKAHIQKIELRQQRELSSLNISQRLVRSSIDRST